MTFLTKLQFGDNDVGIYNKTYQVVACVMHSCRSYDNYSPTSKARVMAIELTIMVKEDMDLALQEWYISRSLQTGRILFEMSSIDTLADAVREVLFEDGTCFSISERYDLSSKKSKLLTLKFNASVIQIDDVKFNR